MTTHQARSQREVLDALADVISVEPQQSAHNGRNATQTPHESSAASYSGQAPMSAVDTQPAVPTKDSFDPMDGGPNNRAIRPAHQSKDSAPPPPAKSSGVSGGFGKLANAFRRHHTDEKEVKRREKERRMQRAIADPSRMDVIDRMDLSGIGASLFHHDSPYDACSPHSNRNARRAPVQAFDPNIDPMTGLPYGSAAAGRSTGGSGHGRPGLSPLAAATMRKMSDNQGDVMDDGKGQTGRSRSNPTNQMPTLGRNMTSSSASTGVQSPGEHGSTDFDSSLSVNSNVERDVEAERAYRNNAYMTQPNNVSRGRSDIANPNADIWGVSSEPWQDFAQPVARLEPPSRSSLEGGGSAASSVLDMEAVMTGKRSSNSNNAGGSGLAVPHTDASGKLSPSGSTDGPKRSRSLIKRIKHARQYGNVPPPDEDVVERAEAMAAAQGGRATSTGTRRTGVKPSPVHQHRYSPSTPPLTSPSAGAIGVQLSDEGAMARSETARNISGYSNGFGNNGQPMRTTQSNASGANVGRSGSIFNRFRGGNKSRERDVAVAR